MRTSFACVPTWNRHPGSFCGLTVRTDVVIVKHPDPYMDERGAEFWDTVMSLLDEEERQNRQQIKSRGASRTLQAALDLDLSL